MLKTELVEMTCPTGIFLGVDCTAGGGGHTALMSSKLISGGKIVAIDRDPQAVNHLVKRFSTEIDEGSIKVVNGRFSEIQSIISTETQKPNAIIADLGVSSPQLDQQDRGFSFSSDGPLDMRMDPTQGQSAAELVNCLEEQELMRIIKTYGEEPKAKFVAKAIVEARGQTPIVTTKQLADIISTSIRYKEKSKKHPATKTFQAIRIQVNEELKEVEELMESAFDSLAPKGRLGIITFHSLEDRIVKKYFQKLSKVDVPRDIPLTHAQIQQSSNIRGKIIKPFPCNPSDNETSINPRARSAKLRVIEKL